MIEYNGKKYLTKGEATEALHTSRPTLWKHIKMGNVPFIELLGKMYIPNEFVQQTIQQQFVFANGVKIRAYTGKRAKLQEL